METANDNITVKCTRCGAKATVGGKDYFYTCPVCNGQINKEAAKKNYEGVSSSNQSTHVTEAEGANGGKINVKCTYCGAKAMVSDEYNLYTCPVCHGQVNTASAKSTYENQQTLKDVSPEKAKVSYQSPKPVSVQTTTTKATKSDPSKCDNIGGIFGLLLLIVPFVCVIIICIIYPIIGVLAIGGIICAIVHYRNEKNGTNEKRRQKEFEQISKEYEEAVESQKSGAPWAKRYSTYPCPYCKHYKVRAANWDDKRYSVAFWGADSSKLGTRYKCDHCGNMWS